LYCRSGRDERQTFPSFPALYKAMRAGAPEDCRRIAHRPQHLGIDEAVQARIPHPVNHAHSAFAQLFFDRVMQDSSADHSLIPILKAYLHWTDSTLRVKTEQSRVHLPHTVLFGCTGDSRGVESPFRTQARFIAHPPRALGEQRSAPARRGPRHAGEVGARKTGAAGRVSEPSEAIPTGRARIRRAAGGVAASRTKRAPAPVSDCQVC
jgi:hypothetical protein